MKRYSRYYCRNLYLSGREEGKYLRYFQTIVQGYFNMMMIVDISAVEENFIDVVTELEEIGKKLGVEVHCQKEEIFTKMHRI